MRPCLLPLLCLERLLGLSEVGLGPHLVVAPLIEGEMFEADMVGQRPFRPVGLGALAHWAVEGPRDLPGEASFSLDVVLDEVTTLNEGRGTLMRL